MPKILLVDDDTELSELLANFLTLEGFRVTIAKTDQIAQQLDLSYDLILLDVIAPTGTASQLSNKSGNIIPHRLSS